MQHGISYITIPKTSRLLVSSCFASTGLIIQLTWLPTDQGIFLTILLWKINTRYFSFSVDATINTSNKCPNIRIQDMIIFLTSKDTMATVCPVETTPNFSFEFFFTYKFGDSSYFINELWLVCQDSTFGLIFDKIKIVLISYAVAMVTLCVTKVN